MISERCDTFGSTFSSISPWTASLNALPGGTGGQRGGGIAVNKGRNRKSRRFYSKAGPAAIILALLATLPVPARAQQAVSPADTLRLMTAAGMTNSGGRVLNPCHHATAPQVRLIDLNGDGRPEALTLDHDPACYGPTPGFQAQVLWHDAAGNWQVIGGGLGVLKLLDTRTRGWRDYTLEGAGRQPIWCFSGHEYLTTVCGQRPRAGQAAPASAAPGLGPNEMMQYPETHGRFAPSGDCSRLPRVTVGAEGIRIETSAGNAGIARPYNVSTHYNGPQDDSVTYQLEDDRDGMAISIDRNTLASTSGSGVNAAERALDTFTSKKSLLRCSR